MTGSGSGKHASPTFVHVVDSISSGSIVAERYELLHRVAGDEPRFRATDLRLAREVSVCFPNLDVHSADLIRGSADRPGAASLAHPALEPLFDVGYDLQAGSTFIITSYEPAVLLADAPPSPELALSAVRELASLLSLLDPSNLGCEAFTAKQLRLVVGPGEDGYRLRVPFTGLYVRNGRRGLVDDLGELAQLGLQLEDRSAAAADPAEGLARLLKRLGRPQSDDPAPEAILDFLLEATSRPDGAKFVADRD